MRSFAYAAALAAPLALSLASPAAAQTATDPTFTGLRVEGLIGWDRSQAYGGHKDGVLYGAAVGYDVAVNNFLVGAEGEINDSTVKDCVGSRTLADPRECANAGRDLYVGGRVGILATPRTLIYAKAGYTNARYKIGYDDGVDRDSYGRNLDGVRVGAGAEYAIGPNSFVKAEYRYSNYEQGISRNQVVGGFGFRF